MMPERGPIAAANDAEHRRFIELALRGAQGRCPCPAVTSANPSLERAIMKDESAIRIAAAATAGFV